MPFLWAIIAGVFTFMLISSNFPHPILITNILLGLIVGVIMEKRDKK